jgi:hypothetical protein
VILVGAFGSGAGGTAGAVGGGNGGIFCPCARMERGKARNKVADANPFLIWILLKRL